MLVACVVYELVICCFVILLLFCHVVCCSAVFRRAPGIEVVSASEEECGLATSRLRYFRFTFFHSISTAPPLPVRGNCNDVSMLMGFTIGQVNVR